MKKTKKQPETLAHEPGEPADILEGMVATLLGTLATAARRVELDKGKDPSLVKQVIDGVTELRKLKAAQQKRHESLTLPMVVAFIRQLDPEDRARVARELQSAEHRRSSL